MSESYVSGLTSQSITLGISDLTGAPKTGLTSSTGSLTAYYRLGATGIPQSIALAAQTQTGAWTSGGFCEIDSVNMPGCYRLDLPNAAIASSLFMVIAVTLSGVTLPTLQRVDCRFVATDNISIGTSVWVTTTRTLSSFGTLTTDTATSVWAAGTRSLTTFGTLVSDTTTAVWAAGARSLTTFGTLTTDTATAVWANASRTLSSFGTLTTDTATAVWGTTTRTLSSFGTLTTDTATAVWAAGTRTLTSLGTVVSDTTAAVWAAANRTLTAFGFTVSTNDATNIAAIKAKTDNLTANPADESLIISATNSLSSQISALPSPPSSSTIATAAAAAILATPSNLLVTNSDGSVNSAGEGGGGGSDPWLTVLPASYTSGQAGSILGNLGSVVVTALSRMIPINGPVPPISTPLQLVLGDDYYDADGRAVGNWSFTVASSPVWTGATVQLILVVNGLTQTATTTNFTSTGTTRTIKFDVPGSISLALGKGEGLFSVVVILASPSSHQLTLIDDSCLEIT